VSALPRTTAAEPSERWLRLLLRLYPADFRDEMGEALVETYRDRCRAAARTGGALALAGVWARALLDSVVNGLGERLRPAVGWRRGGNWGRDTERAVRRLMRAPVFTLTMLATLTTGLGAFAMVYAVVQKVLLAPLPYERPGDLYVVWRDYGKVLDLKYGAVAGTDVVAMRNARTVIQDVAGIDLGQRTLSRTGSRGDDAAPEEIAVLETSPNFFPMLGVQPLLGRTFASDEVGVGRPALVVLGHDLWRDRFAGARTVIGTDILLNGEPHRVIGVMGPEFRFLKHNGLGASEAANAYVTHPNNLAETEPGAGSYSMLIRARPGVTPEAVNAAVRAVGKAVDERDFGGRGIALWPVGLENDLVNRVRPPLLVLGAAGVLLVLVLAVNMATLLLVRATQRDQEFAISRALGANRMALARATLMEAVLLGLLGGAGGALVAVWGTRALVALAPADLPRRETIAVDGPVAAVVIGVGILLGLLAGALPALWATRARLATLLRNAAVRGGGGGHGSMRRAMVVVQVALSVVLLSAGGLVVRSFDRLLRADPGFEAAGVLTLRVPVPGQRYPKDADANALHERLQRELAAIPGVASVGATTALPFDGQTNQSDVDFPGAPGNTGDEDHDSPLVDAVHVLPGYFETLRIRVLAGRTFGAAAPAGVREAVIDRTLASRFFPRGSAVGARMEFRGDSLVVVGVVEHARQYDVHQDGRPQVYVRNADYTEHTLSFALRSGRSPAALISDARAAVGRVDQQLALAEVRPMEEYVHEALRQPRLSAVLLSGFSVGALLLAAMGLYGVIAGAVGRRRHELAVRLALGADHGGVLRLVLREGGLLVLLGLVVGVPGVLVASRLLGRVLVGVSPFDPVTLLAVAGLLGVVALVACWLPARRVAEIEPARLLRQG
jgi:putative ABC transport system permease protein